MSMGERDFTLKRYRCARCGITALSKDLVLRSIHIQDWDKGPDAIYLHWIRGSTLVRVSDDPARAGEREMRVVRTGETFRAAPGRDLEIRVTIPDVPPSELEKEPDAQDPARVLLGWLKSVRRMPEEMLATAVCDLVDGHRWERIEDDG